MSTIEDLTGAIEAGLVPDNPADLHKTMEGLPGFYEALAAKLDELAAFTGGSAHCEQASARLTELAVAAKTASGTAGEAFTEYQHESSGWH
jgi:hypothetical protein